MLKFGKKGIITFLVAALAMVFASGAWAAENIGSYEELSDAVAKGGVFALSDDISFGESNGALTVRKSITIDLNGHTITGQSGEIQNSVFLVGDNANGSLTIEDSSNAKTGKIVGGNHITEGFVPAIRVIGNTNQDDRTTKYDAILTIESGTIEGNGYYAISVSGVGAVFNLNGGILKALKTDSAVLVGNGKIESSGTTININGGEIIGGTGENGCAIYHPQDGVLNISGGTITGYDGVQLKGGTLIMTGGTIEATGTAYVENPSKPSDGNTTTASALSLLSQNSYQGNISATISGIAKLSSVASHAILESFANDTTDLKLVSINILGGTFEAKDASKDALRFDNYKNIPSFSLTGGSYSSDPSAYVESPYVVKQVEGKYVVALAGVAVTPTAAELVLGLTPTAKLTASSDIEETFTWASKNDDVVTVDKSGNITAVGAGTADVTATGATSKSVGTCVVTVRTATPVSVTPSKVELNIGATDKVTAKYDAKDSITWKSSDTAVATVKDGTVTAVKAGIAVITAKGSKTSAACTVTVTDPASPDPVTPTPAPVDAGTVDKENNPVNKEEGKPENVEAATPAITEATEEGKAIVVSATKIEEKNLVATADGKLTISPVLAKSALEEVISADATVAPKNVVLLPIVQAAVTANNVAALAFTMTGEQLGAEENTVAGDVKVIKVLADGKGGQFSYASAAADYADKTFTLKDADGKSLALTDKVAKASTYTLVVFVADNGDFDLDATAGSVIDPVAVATNAATEPKSGSSSSGCNAGFGALALLGLALVPMFYGKKR